MRILYRLLAGALLCLPAAAQTATISDTLTPSVGQEDWTGRVIVTLNNPGSAQPLVSGTTSLAGWSYTLCIGVTGPECSGSTAAGVFTLTLYTNSGITPSGTSYSARFQPARGTTWNETWVVSAGNTKLYQIRTSTVPRPPVILGLNQLAQGDAITGQVLAWDGSRWAPATVSSSGDGAYTASAVIDVIAVPDGSCVLDTTAVSVAGAALGGRTTIGSSYQPPEGVHLFAKVTGPNSMKIEICNLSGGTYDPGSATYYFGVSQ